MITEAAALHARSHAPSPRRPGSAGAPDPHHRTDEFRARLPASAVAGLKRFLKTARRRPDPRLLGHRRRWRRRSSTCSRPATRCWRSWPAASASAGRASARRTAWTCATLEAPWGEAVPPEAVAAGARRAIPKIRAVFVQLSESSTGARARRGGARRGSRAAGRTRCSWWTRSPARAPCRSRPRPGAWTWWWWAARRRWPCRRASPSCPLSARAWERVESAKAPRFYFDLRRERKAQAGGRVGLHPRDLARGRAARPPSTPWRRWAAWTRWWPTRRTLAAMTRAAAEALGLPLVAPRDHGDALTALYPPPGLESGAIVKALKARVRRPRWRAGRAS